MQMKAAVASQSGNGKKSARKQPTTVTSSSSSSSIIISTASAKAAQQMKHQTQAQQQQQQTNQTILGGLRLITTTSNKQQIKTRISMSFILVSLLALLVSISAFSARSSDAKPLNQNQVKFRRLPPREFSALLGSSITIECEAGSSPPPTIHWLKNGKRIQQTHAFGNQLDENLLDDGQQHGSQVPVDDVNRIALSSTRSRLFIDCASDDDEATYTCVAENSYSRVASNTKLNLIRPLLMVQQATGADNNLLAAAGSSESSLSVAAAAAVDLQQQQQQQQQEADSANLSAMPQCLSQRNSRSAEPARIHMWTHNIVEIMKNDVVLFCRSNINTRQQQQQMTRGQQEAIAAAMAAVAPVEQTLSDLISNKLAPKSSSAQASSSSESRQPESSGKSASVNWTLPDDKLVSQEHKDKFEVLESGDLLIKDLRWEDMGSYVCTVSNELGSDSVSTFVYPASVKSVKSKRATAMFRTD